MKTGLKILGIESSCDETAAAIVEDGRKVLSSIIKSQIVKHAQFGGVVPEVASRNHVKVISEVAKQALKEAGDLELKDVDAIAVTYAPGLIGSLLVGVNFAKGLSLANKIPLVAVHHLRAHIAANYLCYKDLKPPFLALIVSGGHSHIVDVQSYTEFKIIGKTLDDAAGEVFDKVARCLGLCYPGGVYLDKMAEKGDDSKYIFPNPKIKSEYDYSFSGLKTCAINMINNAKQRGEEISVSDFSASFRKALVEILIKNFTKAACDLKRDKVVIAGGVSANKLLRERFIYEASKLNIESFIPQLEYCGDNAAMVASQGYFEYQEKNFADEKLNAFSCMSIE